MAKIKFSNGQTVNFNGNPTQADIDEVAQKLGLGSTTPSTSAVPPSDTMNPIQRYGTNVVTDYVNAGKDIVDVVNKGATEYANPNASVVGRMKTLGKTGLNTVGAFAGALFSPLTNAVAPVLKATGADKPIGAAVGAVAATEPVRASIEFYKTLDPETQKGLASMFNIATAVTGQKALSYGSTVAPAVVDTVKGLGKSALGSVDDIASGSKVLAAKVLPTSEGIMQRVARIPKSRQQLFERVSGGESVGKYLEKRGMFNAPDELVPKLYERFTQSRNAADDGLAKLPGTYKDATIGNALSQLLTREKAVSLPGVASKDLSRVRQLVEKYEKGGLNMSEINETKRLFERNVKLGYQKSITTQPEKIAQATNLDTKLREWQIAKAKELGFKELPDINKETQLARQLADDLGKEIAGIGGNNALGLTDAILIAGGDPAAIAMLITKKTAGSKVAQAKVAEWLSKNKIKISTPSTPPVAQVSQLSLPKSIPPKPSVSTALSTEARKYKTAEEFVKAVADKGDDSFNYPAVGLKTKTGEPILMRAFHGTNKDFNKFIIPKDGVRYTGDGVYFTPDKGGATKYGSKVIESYLDLKNPYVMDISGKSIDFQPGSEKIREIIKNGHDSIIVRTGGGGGEDSIINEVVVFDTSSIKTSAQLTDIWKQAHPESTLSPEVQRILDMRNK